MANKTVIVKIPDAADIVVQKIWIREQFEKYYPLIQLIRLDRTKTHVDELYMESSARRFYDPLDIYAYIDHSPSKKLLIKYGIEDQRDIIVTFSTLHLSEQLILENNSTFLIGDLIKFDDDLYEILDQVRAKQGYWINTNIPFFIVCTCNRYRKGE